MIVLVTAIGIGLIAFILTDAFETVVLPRRVPRSFRLGRAYFIATWVPWRALAHKLRGKRQRLSQRCVVIKRRHDLDRTDQRRAGTRLPRMGSL